MNLSDYKLSISAANWHTREKLKLDVPIRNLSHIVINIFYHGNYIGHCQVSYLIFNLWYVKQGKSESDIVHIIVDSIIPGECKTLIDLGQHLSKTLLKYNSDKMV